jgi:preprotein translocase subunit YajC
MLGLIIIILVFGFIWAVVLRPQRKQRQQQARMWDTLEVGDEIVTAGGIYGEVRAFEGDDLRVEIAPNLEVRVARRAVAGVIPPTDPDELIEPEEAHEGGAEGAIEEAGSYSEESR